eukprot:5857260-Alexandrium_andersonii.AAC.1
MTPRSAKAAPPGQAQWPARRRIHGQPPAQKPRGHSARAEEPRRRGPGRAKGAPAPPESFRQGRSP